MLSMNDGINFDDFFAHELLALSKESEFKRQQILVYVDEKIDAYFALNMNDRNMSHYVKGRRAFELALFFNKPAIAQEIFDKNPGIIHLIIDGNKLHALQLMNQKNMISITCILMKIGIDCITQQQKHLKIKIICPC